MSQEELARAYKIALEELAIDNMKGLLEGIPDIEEFVSGLVGTLSEAAKGLPLETVIYKCLMTGATLASARYRRAQSAQEDLISRIKARAKGKET